MKRSRFFTFAVLVFLGIICYGFLSSLRFFPFANSGNCIAHPVTSMHRLFFPELKGTCYNPSIVTIEDGYLLSFRWDRPENKVKNALKRARWKDKETFVCLVELDQNFSPRDIPQTIHLTDEYGRTIQNPEDMRILKVGEDVVGIFNSSVTLYNGQPQFQMHLVNFRKNYASNHYTSSPTVALSYPKARNVEKNWMPFVYNNELHLIYEISPHTVLKPNRETGECVVIAKNEKEIQWNFGELRGGTPALAMGNDFYISFFHSAVLAKQLRRKSAYFYLMGCYVFDQKPPFNITAITPKPILPEDLYTFRHNHRKIIYPSGLTETPNEYILACGENDAHIVIVSLNKTRLLKELREPST